MGELVKIAARQASEILSRFELGDDAAQFAQQGPLPPADFIRLLLKNNQFFAAIKFIAHALPKREAIWWACLAVKKSLADPAPAPQLGALNAAEQWVIAPSEEKRLQAKAWSEKTGQKSAASWVATAVFWSGGSMAKPGEPDIMPPPCLYAHAVAGAISMAAFAINPEQPEESFKLFIRQGLDLAAGGRGEVT